MPSFALICEGITDQITIDTILCGFYDDDLDVTYLQPLRDATDEYRQGNFAGWELVLEYCTKHDFLTEALSLNDYLIIQIDTDCAEHVNFGVALTLHGKLFCYFVIVQYSAIIEFIHHVKAMKKYYSGRSA